LLITTLKLVYLINSSLYQLIKSIHKQEKVQPELFHMSRATEILDCIFENGILNLIDELYFLKNKLTQVVYNNINNIEKKISSQSWDSIEINVKNRIPDDKTNVFKSQNKHCKSRFINKSPVNTNQCNSKEKNYQYRSKTGQRREICHFSSSDLGLNLLSTSAENFFRNFGHMVSKLNQPKVYYSWSNGFLTLPSQAGSDTIYLAKILDIYFHSCLKIMSFFDKFNDSRVSIQNKSR
jgi:hypothetical protein